MLWKVAVPLGFEVMSFDERLEIINEVIKPGYARLPAREARALSGVPAPSA